MNILLHNWRIDLRNYKKFFSKLKERKIINEKLILWKKILLDWGSNHKTAKCLGLKPGALAH